MRRCRWRSTQSCQLRSAKRIRLQVRDRHLAILKVVGAVLLGVIACGPDAFSQDKVSWEKECSSELKTPAVFEDDWIRATAPAGWSECPPKDPQSPRTEPLPGALFKKDDFKLYLLTHTGHASPVEGGRFVEAARFLAPWTDMEEGRCGMFLRVRTTKVTHRLSRADLYFDTIHASKDALEACGNPESKAVLWYGSSFAEICPPRSRVPSKEECGGFYIAYPRIAGRHAKSGARLGMMMFSITFETEDPDYLPERGNRDLDVMLNEATAIVRKIQYK